MKRAIVVIAIAALASQAAAQSTPPPNSFTCRPEMAGKELIPIPEIASKDRVLRGTLYTVSEMQGLPTPAATTSSPDCVAQWVRAYRKDAPKDWNPSAQQIQDPLPGPTLRARIGDLRRHHQQQRGQQRRGRQAQHRHGAPPAGG